MLHRALRVLDVPGNQAFISNKRHCFKARCVPVLSLPRRSPLGLRLEETCLSIRRVCLYFYGSSSPIATIAPRLDLLGFWPGTETKREVWLLGT